MSAELKAGLLDALTAFVADALDDISGEQMKFAIIAVPKRQPEANADSHAVISTNVKPAAMPSFLDLIKDILEGAEPVLERKLERKDSQTAH